MGLIDFADVPSWHDAQKRDPDDAGPIGTRQQWPRSHTGTLVGIEDGCVVYQREVPLAVYAAEVRELPSIVSERLGMPRMHAWFFRTLPSERGTPEIDDDYTVSFSALPHLQNRFFRARLRRLNHHRAAEVNRQLSDALAAVTSHTDPEQRLQTALDQLSFAPFQAHSSRYGKTYGAWMVYPSCSDLLGQSRFDPHRNYTVGLCGNAEECRAQLHGDPIIQQHVKDTFDGSIFLDLPLGGSRVKGPIARPLSEEATSKSPRALDLAIDLALAGLASRSIIATASKSKPVRVARQVALIYRDILYRWTKRNPPRDAATCDYGPQTSTIPDEWDRVDTLRPKVEAHGEEKAIPGLSARLTETDPGDEEMIRLILACPDEWSLTSDLVTFLRESLPLLDKRSVLHLMVGKKLGVSR